MRRLLVSTHRWVGLITAVFLFVAGLTGAIIAWEHELDAWLNPDLYYARSGAAGPDALTPLELADRVEREDARVRVSYLPLGVEPGHTANVYVVGSHNPQTGAPFELPYSQLSFDPNTGQLQGSRIWGAPSLSRENLLPFIYKLHYSLHLPDLSEVRTGLLFMGLVAIAWAIDCLVALWISFPNRKKWRRSFAFRLRKGGHRLNFDLHRSGGVWSWTLLLVMAVTAVSMNLGDAVVRPLVSVFSDVSENPHQARAGLVAPDDDRPVLARRRVIELATQEARQRGIVQPPGAVLLDHGAALYAVGFFPPGEGHADGRLGNPWIHLNAYTGEVLGANLPGEGSAGDLFMQLQFPLHSGRLLGVPGRAVVSVLGVIIAMLSVTGVVIWARRGRARRTTRAARAPKVQALEAAE